jgi:hypothetical protein
MTSFPFPEIQLSPELNGAFFRDRLGGDALKALKRRCEGYQAFNINEWRPSVFEGYAQYFGYLSALKVRSVLEELHHYNLLPTSGFDHLIDFGAGTLGASLGAFDFLRSIDQPPRQLLALDQDQKPCDWALKRFASFLPQKCEARVAQWPQMKPRSLLISVDVWNESALMQDDEILKHHADEWVQLLNAMDEESCVIWIEPATKIINQRLLSVRDRVLSVPHRKYQLFLPCTHSQACPALPAREWCHEDRNYKAPLAFSQLVQRLNFRRTSLVFSLLVFGKKSPPWVEENARVVSRQIHSKGKCELWLCAKGERWKEQRLTRHRPKEGFDPFFDAQRGSVLLSDVTPPKQSD